MKSRPVAVGGEADDAAAAAAAVAFEADEAERGGGDEGVRPDAGASSAVEADECGDGV